MHHRFYSKQNSYLRHEHERHSQSSFLDSVLHRRKGLLSKCIKIIYIQMKRGRSTWALLFHQSGCWSVDILCLNHGSELCKEGDRGEQLASTFHAVVSSHYLNNVFAFQRDDESSYRQLRSCRHRRCHRPWGKPWSRCRTVRVHLPWSSAETACRQTEAVVSSHWLRYISYATWPHIGSFPILMQALLETKLLLWRADD